MIYHHDLSPVLFELGFIKIRYYSLAYIFGLLYCLHFLKKSISKKRIIISDTAYSAFMNYAVLSMIIGGRLGYVLFYGFSYYFHNPIEIVKIYEGGLSFHGGFIGVLIGIFWFAKKYKINILKLFDIIACCAPFGIMLGRMGNFINGELYGRPTYSNFGVVFSTDILQLPRHPSQLYEAFGEGLILFVIINFIFQKRSKDGMTSISFIILYSMIRFFLECFREPDSNIGFIIGSITMGQVLSIILLCFGLYIRKLVIIHSRK